MFLFIGFCNKISLYWFSVQARRPHDNFVFLGKYGWLECTANELNFLPFPCDQLGLLTYCWFKMKSNNKISIRPCISQITRFLKPPIVHSYEDLNIISSCDIAVVHKTLVLC